MGKHHKATLAIGMDLIELNASLVKMKSQDKQHDLTKYGRRDPGVPSQNAEKADSSMRPAQVY